MLMPSRAMSRGDHADDRGVEEQVAPGEGVLGAEGEREADDQGVEAGGDGDGDEREPAGGVAAHLVEQFLLGVVYLFGHGAGMGADRFQQHLCPKAKDQRGGRVFAVSRQE